MPAENQLPPDVTAALTAMELVGEQASAALRALGTAGTHSPGEAATDAAPPQEASPADLSHAMLIAVLMDAGGSLELPAAAFEKDTIGGPDGSFHAVAMDTLRPTGRIRLSVQPRPDVPGAGIRHA